jgi:hypothetical protein
MDADTRRELDQMAAQLSKLDAANERTEGVAYQALNSGVTHEAVCAERYRWLQEGQGKIERALADLGARINTMNSTDALWTKVSRSGSLLACIVAVIAIIKAFMGG